MEKEKTMNFYQDKQTGNYIIERVNQFNHATKREFETTEDFKQALDDYKNTGVLDEHELVITDKNLYALVINHLAFGVELKSNPVGRPSVGVTKKVSLTLSEENWKWLDEKADGNRSKFLREIVWNALGNESEWSNYAALGYAIVGAKKLGYDDEKIRELVREMYWQFDMKSVPEAENIYRESDY